MIEVKNIVKTYGKKPDLFFALKDVSFTIENGDSVAIMGKSGSGKSTLIHIISGLDSPDSGKIIIDGKDLFTLKPRQIDQFRNKQMSFIFQTFFVQPHETVLENVMLPLEIGGISYAKRKEMAREALEKVDLADKAKNRAVDLSGGQKQRLCIARAIVGKPKIIFADEPTGNLDSITGQRIIKLLFELKNEIGSTLIIVTHDRELTDLCHIQIQIKDGTITDIQTNDQTNSGKKENA